MSKDISSMVGKNKHTSRLVDTVAETMQQLQDKMPGNYEYGQSVRAKLGCGCDIVTVFGEPLRTGFLGFCDAHKKKFLSVRGGKEFMECLMVKEE